MNHFSSLFTQDLIAFYFKEDDFHTNFAYISKLPKDTVSCSLKFKQDMVVAGLPFFEGVFEYLGVKGLELAGLEGKEIKNGEELNFKLPFNVALTGERIALNLLQRASAIATYTKKFSEKAKQKNIAILDTRKTTPGHRALEKYAVNVGGGFNHRFGQVDCWMIKDNHKPFFGGLKQALDYFNSMNSFYTPVIVEVHNLDELKEAGELGVKHVMLDNFSPEQIKEAINIKRGDQSFEVSGGISLENLDNYLLEGVDAISSGSLTYNAPHVDISLKYKK